MLVGTDNKILRKPRTFQPRLRFSWNRFGAAGFTSMMMTNERKIWEAALLLVRRHGNEAAAIAEREAERLRAGDDELTCVVWCWIARSTAELLRAHPDAGERVH
jgi:hypothetical protein